MTIDCPFCDGLGLEEIDHLWPSWRGDGICLQCDGEAVISLCVSQLERGFGYGLPDPWYGETARDKTVDVDDYIAGAIFGTARTAWIPESLREAWALDDAGAHERAEAVDRLMEQDEVERRVRRVERALDGITGSVDQEILAIAKRDPEIYAKIRRERAADLARHLTFSAEESWEEVDRLEAAADRARQDWKKRRLRNVAKSIRLNLEHAERLKASPLL